MKLAKAFEYAQAFHDFTGMTEHSQVCSINGVIYKVSVKKTTQMICEHKFEPVLDGVRVHYYRCVSCGEEMECPHCRKEVFS